MIQKHPHMAELSNNKLDQDLFDRFCKLPILPFYKLIQPDADNLKQQKQEFLKSGISPVFCFTRAEEFDIDGYLIALDECRADMPLIESESWILDLYLAKLDELKIRASIIKAMQSGDDRQISDLAKELFGVIKCDRAELENELDQMILSGSDVHIHKKPIDAEKFKLMVRAMLDDYGMQNWKIKFSNLTSVKLSRGRTRLTPTVQIPKSFEASISRAKRVLIHEIEVHALRTQNGINSPLHILRIGLDKYLETDEGLAVYFQSKQGGKRFDPGFWGSYTCALTQEFNFKETFNQLFDARKKLDTAVGRDSTEDRQKERAWNLCIRAYRGISNPDTHGLGMCKDHVYRSGLKKVRSIDIENSEIQKQLFAGNVGLHHVDKIKDLDLSYVQIPELKDLN